MRLGIILGAVMWVFIIWGISKVSADEWTATILLASYHPFSDGSMCNGTQRDYNETNPGLVIGYKEYFIGRYENSYSGCDGLKYSNLVGAEWKAGELGPFEFSITAAIADGYPANDDDGEDRGYGEYMPWASVNAKVGSVKIFYGYRVVALGLVVDF